MQLASGSQSFAKHAITIQVIIVTARTVVAVCITHGNIIVMLARTTFVQCVALAALQPNGRHCPCLAGTRRARLHVVADFRLINARAFVPVAVPP